MVFYNCPAPFHHCRMIRRAEKPGRIVTMSSVVQVSWEIVDNMNLQCPLKAALLVCNKSANPIGISKTKIQCKFVVCPGIIETDMTEHLPFRRSTENVGPCNDAAE